MLGQELLVCERSSVEARADIIKIFLKMVSDKRTNINGKQKFKLSKLA